MKATTFATTAATFIEQFGQAAHRAVDVYREAGERLAVVADERWSTAFAQSSPKLSKETRKNAAHAREVFAGYYAKGLTVTADGAQTAIDTFVEAAVSATQRVADLQRTYASKSA